MDSSSNPTINENDNSIGALIRNPGPHEISLQNYEPANPRQLIWDRSWLPKLAVSAGESSPRSLLLSKRPVSVVLRLLEALDESLSRSLGSLPARLTLGALNGSLGPAVFGWAPLPCSLGIGISKGVGAPAITQNKSQVHNFWVMT